MLFVLFLNQLLVNYIKIAQHFSCNNIFFHLSLHACLNFPKKNFFGNNIVEPTVKQINAQHYFLGICDCVVTGYLFVASHANKHFYVHFRFKT